MGRMAKEECSKLEKYNALTILLLHSPYMLFLVNAYPCTPINTHQGPLYRPEKPALQHYPEISTMYRHS